MAAPFRPHDVNMALDKNGVTGPWRKLPFYLLWAGLAAAGSIAIVQGYQRIFDDGVDAAPLRPVMLPILRTSF